MRLLFLFLPKMRLGNLPQSLAAVVSPEKTTFLGLACLLLIGWNWVVRGKVQI